MTASPSTTRKLAAIGLVAIWAIGTVTAFWWFEFRNLRAFLPEQAVMFRADQLGEMTLPLYREQNPDGPLVVHFWDPKCPCTRFTTPHVQNIVASYAGQGLSLVVVIPEASLENDARAEFGASTTIRVAGAINPVSSPAAALLDATGELAYFGPYSTGAGCTTGDGGFVETVLNALHAGQNPRQINTLATGCFCRWPDASPT